MNAEPVEIVPYDPRWPSLFERERQVIESAINPYVREIQHVGSTAVPGLAAKPVLDIMVGVRTLEDAPACVEGLTGIGYEYVPEFEEQLPWRRFFRKLHEGRRTHQIHLVERSDREWWDRHIAFRDYLRLHSEAAREYGRLKQDLAERFRDDRDIYTDAKTDFITALERRAKSDS